MSEVPDGAEKRRHALKKVLEEKQLTPTDLARLCSWDTPNVIYNFLAGRTKQLSSKNYEAICKALPGVTFEELLGRKARELVSPVLIKTECRAGAPRESFSLPAARIREVPLPVTSAECQAGVYAALVQHPGAEHIYPEGSLLLCLPIDRFDGALTKGRRVLVERFMDSRIEVTVREVQEGADSRLWLSQRSSDPRYADAIKLPSEINSRMFQARGEKFAVAAVIIGAFVPEG